MLIDVSVKMEQGMCFRKGSPALKLETIECYDKSEGHYQTTFLSTSTHIGTHIDVMDKNLFIEPERFIGRGVLIDISKVGLERQVELQDLGEVRDVVSEGDFVFFRTGWDQYLLEEAYFKHPELAFEVIEWLVSKKVNMVGIDALGLGMDKNHGLYDRTLAKNNIFAIENLVGLDKVNQKTFRVYCFPLSIVGTEAIPARILVEVGK